MTKKDLATRVAVRMGKTVVETYPLVAEVIDQIRNAVIEGDTVFLRGFGSFQTKHRAKRRARHIKAGTEITLEAHEFPTFKPCKEFIAIVKDVSPSKNR